MQTSPSPSHHTTSTSTSTTSASTSTTGLGTKTAFTMLSQLSLAADFTYNIYSDVSTLDKILPIVLTCHSSPFIPFHDIICCITLSYFKYLNCFYLLVLWAGLQQWGAEHPLSAIITKSLSFHLISRHIWSHRLRSRSCHGPSVT